MRAIVTGGAGFIGSHLVDALLARGDQVWVVDNLASGKRENVPAEAGFFEHDIRDPVVGDLLRDLQPEACFHLAAQADVVTSVERPEYDAEVNVLGTIALLRAAGTATQLVFSSSGGAIYGECERPAREDNPLRPLSPYGTSKLAGEEYIRTWNRLYGTRHSVLRFANVYGARQETGLEGGVVAIFLERMASGAETFIYGDGRQVRDFVYVGDVVQAVLTAAGRPAGTYNVGSGTPTAIGELHTLCRWTSGSERPPTMAPPRPGDLMRSVVDPSLAERELGWRAETSLEQGLKATWAWLVGG